MFIVDVLAFALAAVLIARVLCRAITWRAPSPRTARLHERLGLLATDAWPLLGWLALGMLIGVLSLRLGEDGWAWPVLRALWSLTGLMFMLLWEAAQVHHYQARSPYWFAGPLAPLLGE